MLMSVLLLSWVWDRVVTNCRGGSETMSHYYFQATMRAAVWGACATGQGNQTEPCLKSVAAPPVPFGPNIGDPGTGGSVFTWFDPVELPTVLPTPPVGGLAAWPWRAPDNLDPVIAVDLRGNRCNQVCQ